MSEPQSVSLPRREDRVHYWQTVVVPTARGLEGFAWRVAWFAIIVRVFFYN